MKYLKKFDTDAQRTQYEGGGEYLEPYVSLVTSDDTVHYNKPHDYSKDYLTTEALEDGTISFNIGPGTDCIASISYKLNNNDWVTTNNTDGRFDNLQITVNVSSGDKVQWKGDAVVLTYINSEYNSFFSSTATFNAYGNIMSMLYEDDFSDKTSIEWRESAFKSLFSDMSGTLTCGVVNAENLILPATTLAAYCYADMFNGCTSLTTAPSVLPATTLVDSCYEYMFDGCTSLTTAPELPATTLASHCYYEMFKGCTSLTTAPVLSATTLTNYCYNGMFQGCTSLNSITCLATDISASNCTSNWVNGVAASGTFTKAASMTNWTTGTSGIPSNWTVQDAS